MSENQDLQENEGDAFDAWLSDRVSHEGEDCLLAEGVVLSEYKIVAFLGRGGCGEVYSARHERLGSMAAIKILRQDTPPMRMRFERELPANDRTQRFQLHIEGGQLAFVITGGNDLALILACLE